MTKPDALDILMLLSALETWGISNGLESWGISNGQRLPEFLQDRLRASIEALRSEVLSCKDAPTHEAKP